MPEQGTLKPSEVHDSILATTRHIVSQEGFVVLWKGLIPRGSRIIGATFILNEAGMRFRQLFGMESV